MVAPLIECTGVPKTAGGASHKPCRG